jgi:predicted double-glycine peptidase
MALAYLGVQRSQAELARLMSTHPQLGTPYSHLRRLHSDQIVVEYGKANELIDLDAWLNNDLPVIAFVQMGELPYTRQRLAQHAVVVIGIDQEGVYIQDPATSQSVVAVPHNDFLLA